MAKKEFNYFSFCTRQRKKSTAQEKYLSGVHHRNGYKYASNGFIFIRSKSDYDKTLENQCLLKNGEILPDIEKYRRLDFDSLIIEDVQIKKEYIPIKIDFDKINEIEKLYKYEQEKLSKIDKNDTIDFKVYSLYVISFENRVNINVLEFLKFIKAMKYYNIDTLYIHKTEICKPLWCNNENTNLIIMPLYIDTERDDIKIYKCN